ncbi:MAG TPA: antitoxin family protein [Pyrinomonadaceae bacterium]|nr:antitoxin family protein [Pyrinomonadaceae bacterium]
MSLTLEVIFDGDVFRPVKPVKLKPNTKMEIIIVDERAEWLDFASQQLSEAYGDDEPEYSLNLIKEKNPEYEGS